MKYALPLSLTATAFLAACGGSGSSDPIALAEINTAGETLFNVSEGLDDDSIGLYDEASLVAKGSARYEGHTLAGVDDTNDIFVGRTSLRVTFSGGGSLTGTATDFVTFVDPTFGGGSTFEPIPEGTEITAVDGMLTYSGGALGTNADGGFGALDILVDGTITIPAALSITDREEVYTIEGEMIGAVTDQETFLAEGSYRAESSDVGFDGFAVIIAD